MARYTANGLPWSNGLGKDVTECVTSSEVMHKAGLDFNVAKCSLVAKMPFMIGGNNEIAIDGNDFAHEGNIYREMDNTYATYRTDINYPLGLVKSDYTVVQNIEAFNFFDEAIGDGKAKWESAGFLRNGQKVFVTAELPTDTIIGGGDNIKNYLVFSNSHDGSSAIDIMFTPIRVACTNMLAGGRSKAFAHIKIRHTKTAKERLDEGARILRIACEHAKTMEEVYNGLLNIKTNDEAVKRYFATLVLTEQELYTLEQFNPTNGINKIIDNDYYTKEKTKISTRKANKIATMWDYYLNGVAQEDIKDTAWGAYNAVTGWLSNVDKLSGESRFEKLCYGSGQTLMIDSLIQAERLAV